MKFFKKLKDNVRIAMDLDDKIPEHIVQGIKAEIAAREVNVGGETVQEFNEQVNKKLKQKVVVEKEEDTFFDSVIGYSDIKKIMLKCIKADDREPTHVILDGPPASAKSLFLEQMKDKLQNSHYVDCVNATGPGLVRYLFEHDVKYLLLDEVEKMNKDDQNVLLNVMETGVLTSTKVRQTRKKKMNLSIYATTNDIDDISKPFRSRFLEFSLPEHTYEDFKEIAIKLLNKKYGHSVELASKIADTVWNKMESKDVRDMLRLGKLSETVEDVDFVATTLQKYKRNDEYEDEY
jgi:replication-associated recombination protein RarA